MELKDFVADTLTQICQGIQIAQENTKAMGAFVSPRMVRDGLATNEDYQAFATHKVSYDVALEVVDQEQSKAGAGLVGTFKVVVASLKGSGSLEQTNRNEAKYISRICFDVPVIYPRVMPVDKEFKDAACRLAHENRPRNKPLYGWEDD